MSGIYIHIPFCKQACHYCDFHFSTVRGRQAEMVQALAKELKMRQGEWGEEEIGTIYFGGGTPSLLKPEELNRLLGTVRDYYRVAAHPEITLEANPDDLGETHLRALQQAGVNRLSIGVQSFRDEDLQLMNRAHSASEALSCLEQAQEYFDNISIDLIYGIPGLSLPQWEANLEQALAFNILHISAYALTVEPRTALKKFIEQGVVPDVDEEEAKAHFVLMTERLGQAGFLHYEFSNFGKPGYFSANNSGYWQGKHYLGIGPSAHSYDGRVRSWNVANNAKYLRAIGEGTFARSREELTLNDRYNEYIMTGLRTMWGISLEKVRSDFGMPYYDYLMAQAEKYLDRDLVYMENNSLVVGPQGKFLTDGIASDLFMVPADAAEE